MRLSDLEFSKSDSEPVDLGIAGSAGESEQLFLGRLCGALQFRKLLSTITMLPTCLPPGSIGHCAFLAFLVDGYLVISM